MKKFICIILLAVAAVLTTCTPCEAKGKHETVVASVFTLNTNGFAPFASPKDNAKLAIECDSLVAMVIKFNGDSLCYKGKTKTLLSSFYLLKRRINGRLFVECYHVPTFCQGGQYLDKWLDAIDFYKAMYDSYYEYVGSTPYIFSFVKQNTINI